jgi:hypothetical protein
VSGEGSAGSLRGKVLILLLGGDCVARMETRLEGLSEDMRLTKEIALATGV